MRKNKVCFINKNLYPLDTRLKQQVDTLQKNNIPCDILCLKGSDQPNKEVINDITIYRFMKPHEVLGFFRYILNTIKFGFIVFLKLFVLSLFNNYKVIVIHTLPEFLLFSALLNKIFGAKLVLDARDLTVTLLASRWKNKKISTIKTMAILIEKICTKLSDHIITANEGFGTQLNKRGTPKEKITILINGADQTIFQPDPNRIFKKINNNARFIYHGTVSHRFGVLFAIKAMVNVLKIIPNSQFHIYGFYDPKYKEEITQFIQQNDLLNAVFLHNAIPLTEIATTIQNIDLGIVPYMSDSFMNIALSTKTFEYIAAGLPVISSQLDSIEYYFDNNEISYTIPENSSDIADKIIFACQNPAIRKKLSTNALIKYCNIDNSVMNNRFLNIINQYN